MKKAREKFCVGVSGRGIILHRSCLKEEGEHGLKTVDADRDSFSAKKLLQFETKYCRVLIEACIAGFLVFEQIEGRPSRLDRNGISGQRSRLINIAGGGQSFHDVLSAAESAHRQAATDNFAQAGQIRPDVDEVLIAAEVKAKTGNDFVKYQDDFFSGVEVSFFSVELFLSFV